MDVSALFSQVIASVLASAPPDAGSPEAAIAGVVRAAGATPPPPLFGDDQRRFVQRHVLPVLHVLIARAEVERLVTAGPYKDLKYYTRDKQGQKEVGVQVLASRYYHDHDFRDMPIRTYGVIDEARHGPYYHCAELVWNSAILAGFHVPMNKNPKAANFYGFYNSANVLYNQCDTPWRVPDLEAPAAADSFRGARVGDMILGRRNLSEDDDGERAPGHLALLNALGPPTFCEAGTSVGSDARYGLNTDGIAGHECRLIRLRNPDWGRIERWLSAKDGGDFADYFSASYPAEVKERSYQGLFGVALARVGAALANDQTESGRQAQAQLTGVRNTLGLKE